MGAILSCTSPIMTGTGDALAAHPALQVVAGTGTGASFAPIYGGRTMADVREAPAKKRAVSARKEGIVVNEWWCC